MKKSDWKNIAELVGVAAIVASLIFVGVQLKQTQQSLNMDRILTEMTIFQGLQSRIIENSNLAELMVKARTDNSSLTDAE